MPTDIERREMELLKLVFAVKASDAQKHILAKAYPELDLSKLTRKQASRMIAKIQKAQWTQGGAAVGVLKK